jgi:hypothetical protein
MIMEGAQNDDNEQGEWNHLVRVFDELENVMETRSSTLPSSLRPEPNAALNWINFDSSGRYMDTLQEPYQIFPMSSTHAQLPALLQPEGQAYHVTNPFSRQPQHESYRTHGAAPLQSFEMISHLPLSIGRSDRASLATSVPLALYPEVQIRNAPTLEQQLMRSHEEQKESHQMQQWLQTLATHDAHNAALLNLCQEPLPARLPPVPHFLAASSTPTSRSPSSGQSTSPSAMSDDIYAAQYPLPQHKLLKPLTAYNYFYRDERDNIVDGITTALDPFPNPVSDFSQSRLEALLHQRWYIDPIKKKRAHRKKHGKLGFEEYV